MHCTLQYTIDTKKYSIKLFNSSYVWSICSQKMTFSTRKSGIPPESSGIPPESSGISPGISGIPFFKFEFTFRSENAVFGGISSGIPFPVIGGIRKKNEKVNPTCRCASILRRRRHHLPPSPLPCSAMPERGGA